MFLVFQLLQFSKTPKKMKISIGKSDITTPWKKWWLFWEMMRLPFGGRGRTVSLRECKLRFDDFVVK